MTDSTDTQVWHPVLGLSLQTSLVFNQTLSMKVQIPQFCKTTAEKTTLCPIFVSCLCWHQNWCKKSNDCLHKRWKQGGQLTTLLLPLAFFPLGNGSTWQIPQLTSTLEFVPCSQRSGGHCKRSGDHPCRQWSITRQTNCELTFKVSQLWIDHHT